jgi:serine/threonine protein kinase
MVQFFGGSVGQTLTLVTEFCESGNLFDFLHRSQYALDWKKKLILCIGVANGIQHLHHLSPPMIHRDLKTLNFLLKRDTNTGNVLVKVADFGTSTTSERMYMTGGVGTYHWMAPEVLAATPRYDTSADIFSLGVILWEISARQLPYPGLNHDQIKDLVLIQRKRPNLNALPRSTPENLKGLM